MVVIQKEKVVKIAADFLGGRHIGVQIKIMPLRERGKCVGQNLRLNLGGQRQLGADALLFGGDFCKVLDVILRVVFHLLDGSAYLLNFADLADLDEAIVGKGCVLGGIPRSWFGVHIPRAKACRRCRRPQR